MHVFAEEGLRNFFDIIAITDEKGAKSSLYWALPDTTSNPRHIGSPSCQHISSSLFRASLYRATYCNEKTIAILGDRRWPPKTKQEGDEESILFVYINKISA